jgi:1-acyl-sn-glycerol-3-phosphate acyltransferase
MPRLRARLDVVFGAPVRVEAPGRRSRAVLEAASNQLRDALVAHHTDTHRQFGGQLT